ncbi:hypothetical protein [Halomicrobium salinisoli]|uniref:hypothetical protein n=1 Tax=Halomicrobium salinisoli TaxID=2878391 RepID=UPI001CF02FA7|nr:hypothetical protein [Halomicrobium salinisoli]
MVNAFWLDRDVERAAAWLVDTHVTSSVFECAMVLTTAAQVNGYPESEALYFTHEHHPLTRWAARSHANWRRLYEYADAAHEEWRRRWDHDPGDEHGSWTVVQSLDRDAVRDLDWPETGGSDPPQVTGEWSADDYVDAYRYYYANDKRHLFEWSGGRSEPPWIAEYTVADGDDAGEADRDDTDEDGANRADGDDEEAG